MTKFNIKEVEKSDSTSLSEESLLAELMKIDALITSLNKDIATIESALDKSKQARQKENNELEMYELQLKNKKISRYMAQEQYKRTIDLLKITVMKKANQPQTIDL